MPPILSFSLPKPEWKPRPGSTASKVGKRAGAVVSQQVEDVDPDLQPARVQQVLVGADAFGAEEPALIAVSPRTEGRLRHAGDAHGAHLVEGGCDGFPLLSSAERRDQAHHQVGRGELAKDAGGLPGLPGPSRCRRRWARPCPARCRPAAGPCCSPRGYARRSPARATGLSGDTASRSERCEAETGVGQALFQVTRVPTDAPHPFARLQRRRPARGPARRCP